MSEPEVLSRLAEEALDHQSGAVALRRTLHEWPEIGNHLPVTRNNVLEALEGLPLGITLHETTSGVAATLEGDHPGPTMLLRGDMDALPMPEDTGLDFASRVDGAMHACGHDTHVAMLVGAARLLAQHRSDIHGRVLFMFQPGEEGHHGAQHMIDEGLFDLAPLTSGIDSPITGAFAIHTTSSLPTGFVSSRGGPLMASSDSFSIRLVGKGGHGSEPFRALDPVPAACELVQALQSMITRRINVFNPSVLSVTQLRAGTAFNVIPEVAEIGGTIRAISETTRSAVHDGIKRVAEGIAKAHDLQVEIDLHIGYDVTVNDHDYASIAAGLVRDVVGHDRFIELPNPVMGAEDFGVVLERIPGAMVFLGATPHDRNPAAAAPNHSNRVFYDEDAMSTGIALYSAAALRHLQPA
ncbi:MAG: M20 family metallopeptidase [Actinomycetota bacterium]|nr:M20 family metallopeptidase [Actinomycetota bacterium]MDA2971882.1 M20 family metallopeptidase [Actinomycetota bacterium]MDA3001200.1 M20 family metallopeptidase [Actinomycetota bacterium]